MTRKRASKAHALQLQELPVVASGGIRIEVSCPSGCVQGYLWSRSADHDEAARLAAWAVAETHAMAESEAK